jgi:hypothetical protein
VATSRRSSRTSASIFFCVPTTPLSPIGPKSVISSRVSRLSIEHHFFPLPYNFRTCGYHRELTFLSARASRSSFRRTCTIFDSNSLWLGFFLNHGVTDASRALRGRGGRSMLA